VSKSVYIRVFDRYEVYTGEITGTPAWQSGWWLRDAYKTRIWDPTRGYLYQPGQDCVLAR
jgi:hypothetical protein